MILEGNQRGGARDLALHLLKEENEHVEIHEMRGFVSGDLLGAFQESYALSRGTKCKQHLFSLSLNPPPGKPVPTEAFTEAANKVEARLGLSGQPRVIVFHEKQGRRHAHAVWSRIDTQAMKAVQLSHSKRKLMEISRELFIEHGWTMPRGLMASDARDPANYTLAQWQQAKRAGKSPKRIKLAFQDCWAVSDSQAGFAAALKERGYILARGDRRGFVGVDTDGEVYAVAKWAGIKTKDVRAKLTDPGALPSVDEARKQNAAILAKRLETLQQNQDSAITERQKQLTARIKDMTARHRQERADLQKALEIRRQREIRERQQHLKTGWRGLWQRVTGKRSRIEGHLQWQTYQALKRDQATKDRLIFNRLQERLRLQRRTERLKQYHETYTRSLSQDLRQYRETQRGEREVFKAERSPRPPAPVERGPTR